MKDRLDDGEEQVPSYEESEALSNISGLAFREGAYDTTSDTKSPRQPLQSQIASTRSHRIQSVLAAYIEPLIHTQGLEGISKSTFTLIPSDTLSDLPNLKATDLVGLPGSARYVTVVRLHGPDNQANFWEQPAVIQQLISELRPILAASGYSMEKEQLPLRPDASAQRAGPAAAAGRSSWLKRSFNTGQNSDPTASMSHWKLGWMSEDEDANKRWLERDEMRVNAKFRDVSAMRESELGLLLTETVKAIWMEIEFGT